MSEIITIEQAARRATETLRAANVLHLRGAYQLHAQELPTVTPPASRTSSRCIASPIPPPPPW